MNWITARGVHHSVKKVAVSAVFIGISAAGVAVPASVTPSFLGTPGTPVQLQDPNPAPNVPTNPPGTDCTPTPTDPECAGSPYTALTPGNVPPSVPVWPTPLPTE